MSVTTYNPNNCKYKLDKLDNVLYLISEQALKHIQIDNGDAFVSGITETPLALNVYNISLVDTDELDERYKFTHTLTFSMKGYANHQDFEGRYYAIVKSLDGVYWLVNPLFPCKVAYTYTLDYNGSHTDFTLSTASNHPTLRLIGFEGSRTYECGYERCIFQSLRLNEKQYTRKSGNIVRYTNDGFKDVVFKKNSAIFRETFDGNNISHSLDFNIDFDDYKSSWHYNLLEFVDNKYAAIIKTSCGNFLLSGFGFGLQPSFNVNGSDTQIDTISISMSDLHDNGNFIWYASDLTITKSEGSDFIFIKDGYECVGENTARYILKQETDKFGNPLGNYLALEGYENNFPNLNIVGTFSTTENFVNPKCENYSCRWQNSFPREFVFNTEVCRTYNVIGDTDWTLSSSSNDISVFPTSGEAGVPYQIQVCNRRTPTESAYTSTITVNYCNTAKTFNVTVVEGDGCFTAGQVFDISANGQYVVIPTQCCIDRVVESSLTITNIQIFDNYIRVYVPQNDTQSDRSFTLVVIGCDDNTSFVTINQGLGFERWLSEYFTCSGGLKCEVERRYTGLTPFDINTWTSDVRLANCVESSDCSGYQTRWVETTATTCNGGRKYYIEEEQESSDEGQSWSATGSKRLGAETEDSPAECEGAEDEEQWIVEPSDYWCNDGNKYEIERLYTRPVGTTDWIETDVTRMGELIEANSSDCGVVPASDSWDCEKWELADGYICEDTTKYAREQRYVRNCASGCSACTSSETWVATDAYRRSSTVLESNSVDCGYIKGTEEWNCSKWELVEVPSGVSPCNYGICEDTTLYYKEELLVSDCQDCSNCSVWNHTGIFRRTSTVLEADSKCCGAITGSSEWNCEKWELDAEYYICEETTKYKTEERFVRMCSGACSSCTEEWHSTSVYRIAEIEDNIWEEDSTDCGFYIPTTAWTCEKWVILEGLDDYICEEDTKYAKEQRYVRNCSGECSACTEEWIPTGVFRRSDVVREPHSEDCGYNPEIQGNCVKWEWDDDTICDSWNLYQYLHKYVRQCDDCEDCDALWIPTDIYKRGELVRANSLECGYIPADTYVRWESEDTQCYGYDLYERLRKYVSEDQIQWYATDIYKQGDLIEENSLECHYIPTEYSGCTQWRPSGHICDGWDLYERLRKYITEDCIAYYATNIYKRGQLVEQKSLDCGYVPIANCTEWRDDGETICEGYDKYEYLTKYISDDCDERWYQTQIHKRGSLIEANSFDCNYIPIENCFRWEYAGTICNGYDLYQNLVKVISDDCDERWYETEITKMGDLIERDSKECGWNEPIEYEYRWVATTATTCYRYDLVYYYKKQRRRLYYLSAQWEDVIPTEYSVDGAGTLPIRYAAKDTPDCGWAPATEPIYEWRDIDPSIDWICDDCEEPIYRLELATDEWICDECPEPEPPEEQYRWVDSGTTCVGVDKWQQKVKQVSLDSGVTWANVVPEQLSATSIIQANSVQCGYVPEVPFKYIAENTNGFVSSAACDSNTELKGTRQECWDLYGNLVGYTDFPLFWSSTTAVTIGDCVTRLGYYSFVGNTGISTIHIPSGVTSIGGAFMRCTSLSSITFDNAGGDMSHFGGFSGCTSLTEIDIPRTVISSNDKFDGCTNLERIIFRGGLCDARDLTFSGCSENMVVEINNNNGRGWGLPFINGAGEFAGVKHIWVEVDAAEYEKAWSLLWENPLANWYRYRHITSLICDGCNN